MSVEAVVLQKPGSLAPRWVPTRKSLLSRLKDWRDDDSWRTFFETYSHLLYYYVVRAGLSDAEAQDIVQETVISVCKSIRKLEYDPSKGTFKHWLWVMTQRRIMDYFRRRQRRSPAAVDESESPNPESVAFDSMADPAPSMYAIWEAEWDLSLQDAALRKVKLQAPLRQYQIFDLYVIQGCTMAEVTRVFGVTSAYVSVIKHRLSKLLRREFETLRDKPF